jgi:phospholipid/cholesterol/gamma-HCH transport system permease protein
MLSVIFAAIGIFGGKVVGVDFWVRMKVHLEWHAKSIQFMHDIFNGTMIKSIVFALICTWIAVYQGYACEPTSEGIATSTTRTVVYSSLCVLGFDLC